MEVDTAPATAPPRARSLQVKTNSQAVHDRPEMFGCVMTETSCPLLVPTSETVQEYFGVMPRFNDLFVRMSTAPAAMSPSPLPVRFPPFTPFLLVFLPPCSRLTLLSLGSTERGLHAPRAGDAGGAVAPFPSLLPAAGGLRAGVSQDF